MFHSKELRVQALGSDGLGLNPRSITGYLKLFVLSLLICKIGIMILPISLGC